MSQEHKPHHKHHHSHGRRNWVLPLICVAMVVGGGYWMNATTTDPGPQQAGPTQAGPFGSGPTAAGGSSQLQAEPAMESIAPAAGQSAAAGLPPGMEPVEPGVGNVIGLGAASPAVPDQTTTR